MAEYDNFLQALSADNRMAVENFFGSAPVADAGSVDFSPTYGAYSNYNPYRNINPNRYNNLDRRDAPGDQLYADLIRAQTQDYLNRFAPIEDQLANMITPTGTTMIDADLDRTRGSVMSTAMNVQDQRNRAMGRYGLYGDSDIGSSNATISALVGGINDTYLRDQDRRQALLTGGLAQLTQRARNMGS